MAFIPVEKKKNIDTHLRHYYIGREKRKHTKVSMGKIMVESSAMIAFILLVIVTITIPCTEAGIAEFDDFLKNQSDEAHKLVLDSYVPIPEEIADDLNLHVNLYVSLHGATIFFNGKTHLLENYFDSPYVLSRVLKCLKCHMQIVRKLLVV